MPQKLETIIAEIQAAFPNELYEDDSTKPGQKFCAFHMGWYNIYAESVSGLIIQLKNPFLMHLLCILG